jgi:RNA polymerase sigma-70 factor (ECF subfamily)
LRDSVLVRRILSGDRAAGERLVSEHYPRVCRFLRHLAGHPEEAEHLAQQTFVNAWRALADFRGQSSLATWLHRIAYHAYTHHLKAHREHAPLEAAEASADPEARIVDAVLLHGALAQLSAEHRTTFLLHYVQDFSVAEVAAVLDIAEGTAKSRLFSARQRLRELLSETEEAVPDGLPEANRPYEAAR